jgi:hypothetical protein
LVTSPAGSGDRPRDPITSPKGPRRRGHREGNMRASILAILGLGAVVVSARGGDIVTLSSPIDSSVGRQTIVTLPASGTYDDTADIGSTSNTTYNLTQQNFNFSFQHLLSGEAGSEIGSSATLSINTNADIYVSASGSYRITQQLWTSAPPTMQINAQVVSNGGSQIYVLGMGQSTDGSALAFTSNPAQAPGRFLQAGHPNPYRLTLYSNLTANGAGSAAKASGTIHFHMNLWGDFNDDGSVGFDDLLTLAQHWGSSARMPPTLTGA